MAGFRSVLLRAAALGALAGCAPTLPDLNAETQWGNAVRRLSLLPFFPLQEDVQVGDVFLYVQRTDREATDAARFSLVRLGSIGLHTVLEELQNQDARRLRIRPSPVPPRPDGKQEEKPGEAGTGQNPGTPPPNGNPPATPFHVSGAEDHGAKLRLRRVAVPAVTVARYTEADLVGSGFFGNVGALLGIGASGATALTISVDNASEMHIDSSRAYELMLRDSKTFVANNLPPDTLLFHLRQQRETDAVRAYCRGDVDALNTAGVSLIVATRVLYAQTVKFEFARESAFGAQLAANLARVFGSEFGETLKLPDTLPPRPGGGGQPGENQRQGPAAPTASERARAAQDQVTRLLNTFGASAGETPGVRASLGIGQFGGVTLDKSYRESLAIGTGDYMRFGIEELSDIYREIAEGDPVGHFPVVQQPGPQGADTRRRRSMAEARANVHTSCERLRARERPSARSEKAAVEALTRLLGTPETSAPRTAAPSPSAPRIGSVEQTAREPRRPAEAARPEPAAPEREAAPRRDPPRGTVPLAPIPQRLRAAPIL